MRGEHRYVKAIKRTTAPVRMICVVPEVSPLMDCATDGEYYYNSPFVWYTDSRRYGTRWTGSVEPVRIHSDDFWSMVNDVCKNGCRINVVTPNACDFATVSGFWKHIDRGLFHFGGRVNCSWCIGGGSLERHKCWQGRLVTGNPPDIVHFSNWKGTVCLVSIRNYTEASWREIASSCHDGHHGQELSGHVEHSKGTNASDVCTIGTRYMRQLIAGWVGRDCGPWKDTIAQLSVSWWRRSFYTQKVCRHNDNEAILLERQAAFGGRNEVWCYADVGSRDTIPDGSEPCPKESGYPPIRGPVYRCDISAQYPTLLRDKEFPIRLVGVRKNLSVADLKALLRYYGVIAHVRIRTDRPEYPCKRSGEIAYPVGRYDSTIAGPELSAAIASGEISGVYQAAYYELGRPLQDYATHLLSMRSSPGNKLGYCDELFAKCLATAIGGKFSQRTRRREACYGISNPFGRWGPFTQIDQAGQLREYVSVAGISYADVECQTGGKLLAALYCYLTSYGRVQMREIREGLYPCIPYSQCTDGIWVGDIGREKLVRLGMSADRIPGTLREVSSHTYARWITPNHYYVDGRWTLSGYKHGCVIGSDLVATEFRDKNPVRTVPFKAPMAIRRECIKRSVTVSRLAGRIGPDGWLIPPQVKG